MGGSRDVAWELKVEALGGAKTPEAENEEVAVVDREQGAADWRVGSKQRAEVEVEVDVNELLVARLEGIERGVVCVSEDDRDAEENTQTVDVTTAGNGGPVTVVPGKAIDKLPEPSLTIVTVSVIVIVELQVVVMPLSVVFAVHANPGEAKPTVVLAAARLDMA